MAGIDWAAALDFERAATNIRSELAGDWHRDPWGWPEIDCIFKSNASHLIERLQGSRFDSPALIDVPKENWGSRPAVVLSIVDRLMYQSLVDRVSLDLIGDLHRSVFGWRLPPSDPKRGVYSHNDLQWEVYRDHLANATVFYNAGLRSDLVSCFATIPIEPLQESIDDRLAQGAIKRRLFTFLDATQKIPERSGLPQRSSASAVLANMYMTPLDDVLEHFANDVPFVDLIGKNGASRGTVRTTVDLILV